MICVHVHSTAHDNIIGPFSRVRDQILYYNDIHSSLRLAP